MKKRGIQLVITNRISFFVFRLYNKIKTSKTKTLKNKIKIKMKTVSSSLILSQREAKLS